MELPQTWIQNNLVITVPHHHLPINIGRSLKQLASEISTRQAANIILDATHVKKFDSTALGGLILCYKCIQGRGQMWVCGMNDHFRQILKTTGVEQLIHHCPTVEDALSELSYH